MRRAFLTFGALLLPLAATACPDAEAIEKMARDWTNLTPLAGLPAAAAFADGECARDRLVARLARTLGRPVGHKAGLTNPAVQQRFGHDAPVRGVLLEGMLLRGEVAVSAAFGVRPLMEADLVVEVKDEGVNAATTPAEVMAHLSRLFPFIELPDLALDPKAPLNGPNMVAINVGARLGALGAPIAADAALVEPLGTMTVTLRDESGAELGQGPGAAILGHPLNAVVWIARDLARTGDKLKAGDLLSLGSFTAPVAPKAGRRVTARYEGLPGAPGVSVRFQ